MNRGSCVIAVLIISFLLRVDGARFRTDEFRISANRAAIQYTSEAQHDRVTSLPGWGSLETFNMFSGYITVDEAAGRALFYIFVESMRSPSEDPLVLWLNGGPGCSSLGGGFLSELGPFFPNIDGKTLKENPYPWNKVASVLFLESPALVGFSYSNTSSDRIVGDARTAADSRAFLLGFIQRFPHLRQQDLYLSGESYAGHYVPNLALEIVRGNAAATAADEKLNLQGFLVGNPWTDAAIDNLGAVDFWWHHALVSDETAAGLKQNCDFSKIGPLQAGHVRSKKEIECDNFVESAFEELGPINIYEIYADVCYTQGPAFTSAAVTPGAGSALAQRLAALLATNRPGRPAGSSSLRSGGANSAEDPSAYDPCIDNEVEMYLNRPDVQKALHANQTVILPYKWTDCTDRVQYSRKDLLSSMLPVYEELLASADLRILVYSGDVDGIVPVVGTRRWTAGLCRKTERPWRSWLSGNQQVGGWIVEYDGLTFATVRNAGHMVPYVQPERMYRLYTTFLDGECP